MTRLYKYDKTPNSKTDTDHKYNHINNKTKK